MSKHIENRHAVILKKLTQELVGPAPAGPEILCNNEINFDTQEEAYGPRCQAVTKDEILDRVRPSQKYGVGVLYPDTRGYDKIESNVDERGSEEAEVEKSEGNITSEFLKQMEKLEKEALHLQKEIEGDDYDLSGVNSYRPNSIGVSFLLEATPHDLLKIKVTGGRYLPMKVLVKGKRPKTWWRRKNVELNFELPCNFVTGSFIKKKVIPVKKDFLNGDGLNIVAEVFVRQHDRDKNQFLVTVCVINRTVGHSADSESLFQTRFEVIPFSQNSVVQSIVAYPSVTLTKPEQEDLSIKMLYRNVETFAIGHGCAADWDRAIENKVSRVSAEPLPIVELPSITSDIKLEDGSPLEVSIKALAGLDKENDGHMAIKKMIESYEHWIGSEQVKINNLEKDLQDTAELHLANCRKTLLRMNKGLKFLEDNEYARMAFKVANHAMFLQQIISETKTRNAVIVDGNVQFSEPLKRPDIQNYSGTRGKWRAFQIAFLLMSIESAANGGSIDRDIVELIWFPTGGGKTEAYLGLAAFQAAYQRLQNPNHKGVTILMRYTLRLLTAQQFQRASGLFCALEYLRNNDYKGILGHYEFSIGLWVGGDVTPNKQEEARSKLKYLESNTRSANPFLVDRCPWCKAQMGPVKLEKSPLKVLGYVSSAGSVIFKCPDIECDFRNKLPIYVIDEDIYQHKPTMLIGTVDKFATLAWKPTARKIFGLEPDGSRIDAPPSLIIQDELHLISGPLGSMVGLYEALIEELCTVRGETSVIRPKIISSTATIRQYEKQIKSLYGRERVCLFPAPGINVEDSFFSRYAKDKDGSLARGKIYVGVFAPGLSSMQTTQVRSLSALLQAPMELTASERDPWWTLLIFFNSLRELGTTLSLLQSDIPTYLKTICNRMGIKPELWRWLNKIKELTSRLRNDEIPQAMTDLEIETTRKNAVDVCLASNIIEVGIDIDRLSLMAIVGQPKTTSQYIQVSGRVGRRWWERPGMVVTLYGVAKPRDRSHYEKFKSYHQRLYAHVEPTSSTPFSPPVLDRALHGLMVAYARQFGNTTALTIPKPMPAELLDQLENILIQRVNMVDPEELKNFQKVFKIRKTEWEKRQRVIWQPKNTPEIPLMYRAGTYIQAKLKKLVWAVPSSLRNVDADCEAYITSLYHEAELNEAIGEIDVE